MLRRLRDWWYGPVALGDVARQTNALAPMTWDLDEQESLRRTFATVANGAQAEWLTYNYSPSGGRAFEPAPVPFSKLSIDRREALVLLAKWPGMPQEPAERRFEIRVPKSGVAALVWMEGNLPPLAVQELKSKLIAHWATSRARRMPTWRARWHARWFGLVVLALVFPWAVWSLLWIAVPAAIAFTVTGIFCFAALWKVSTSWVERAIPKPWQDSYFPVGLPRDAVILEEMSRSEIEGNDFRRRLQHRSNMWATLIGGVAGGVITAVVVILIGGD